VMTSFTDKQAAAYLYAVHVLPLVLAPYTPHIADELWSRLGHERSVHLERIVDLAEEALAVDEITLVVQVNGKIRARIPAAPGIAETAAIELALADRNVQSQLEGKEIRKRVFVQDKLVNLVVG
jgi:leucyl-tRNA synthetase